jgi:hypothetical protein
MPKVHNSSCILVSLCSALLFLLPGVALGQITNVNDTTSTPIPGAGHDYIKMLNETVNPANGSVSVRIHVPMPKGRGLTLPFSFDYDSNSVNILRALGYASASWVANSSFLSQGGWGYSVPIANLQGGSRSYTDPNTHHTYTCNYWTDYMFQDPTGGRHALGIGYAQQGGDCLHVPNYPVDGPHQGGDDLFSAYTPGGWLSVAGSDGTAYYWSSFGGGLLRSHLPDYIEDVNGNRVTVQDSGGGAFTFTDTLGRAAISSNGFGPSGQTNTITFSNLSYQITWRTISSVVFTVPSTRINVDPAIGCQPFPNVNTPQTVVHSITLPNNQQYTFYYGDDNPDLTLHNPFGLLSEIIYPSGGWIKYTWQLAGTSGEYEVVSYPGTTNIGQIMPGGCQYRYSVPMVATRQVSFNGGAQPDLVKSFSYDPVVWSGSGWTTKVTRVTTTDNIRNQSFKTVYTYTPVAGPPTPPNEISWVANQIAVESKIDYCDWGATTYSSANSLRTVKKSWSDPYDMTCEQVAQSR